MDVEVRQKVVETAKQWLGTPWKHNHRCKGFGIDCVNLLGVCAEAVGMKIDLPKVYNRIPSHSSLHLSIERYFKPIHITLVQKGDIHLFSVNGDNNHVGIALDDFLFIHACFRSNSKGRVQINNLSHPFWNTKWRKSYDLLSYKGDT